MASSLLALLDDIASILDDVALLSKAATKKTAGVLGDDLALNAQQVAGVKADRELPVVWAVFKGSLLNKAIIVPVAFGLSLALPWLILPLLVIGGAFLCYEGAHKLVEKLLHSEEEERQHHAEHLAHVVDPTVDLVAVERDKVKGAIRTDFILSTEIIVITLGTVADKSAGLRIAVLIVIALVMTVGVYGLVAGIVRLDDLGQRLVTRGQAGARAVGKAILAFAPRFMRFLSIAGTAAMFMVGGGIITHAIGPLYRQLEAWAARAGEVATVGGVLAWLIPSVGNLLVGVVVGVVLVLLVMGVTRIVKRKPAPAGAAAADEGA
jgi:predicted DNA repair protein MutK